MTDFWRFKHDEEILVLSKFRNNIGVSVHKYIHIITSQGRQKKIQSCREMWLGLEDVSRQSDMIISGEN